MLELMTANLPGGGFLLERPLLLRLGNPARPVPSVGLKLFLVLL